MIARNSWIAAAILCIVIACAFATRAAGAEEKRTLNVVVVTGGHGYDEKAFPKLFAGHDDVKITMARQKEDSELFEDISDWKYDVIVFYHMTQKISPKRQANFQRLLENGVGVVALHHSIGAFQNWPEYAKIVGGKYLLSEMEIDGVKYAPSTYKEGLEFKVQISAPDHPIMRGVKDFAIEDETYKGQWIDPKATVLMTTDAPTSDKALGWAKTYAKSRVCLLVIGHGPAIFTNENYQRMVYQAIRWSAEK